MLLKFSKKLMGTLRITEKNFYLGCMPVKTTIPYTEGGFSISSQQRLPKDDDED
jgi:hypothetical protein